MNLDELRQRVEERVQETLFPKLLERYKRYHMKRDWRECDCSYCNAKRYHHAYMQFAPYHLSYEKIKEWRDGRITYCRAALSEEAEKVL